MAGEKESVGCDVRMVAGQELAHGEAVYALAGTDGVVRVYTAQAGDELAGFAQGGGSDGEEIAVRIAGVTSAIAAAEIAQGQPVNMAYAAGRVTAAADREDCAIGRALVAATEGGLVEVLIHPGGEGDAQSG